MLRKYGVVSTVCSSLPIIDDDRRENRNKFLSDDVRWPNGISQTSAC